MRKVLWVGLAGGLLACGGQNAESGGNNGETVVEGRPIDSAAYAQVKKGESSKADVSRLLGEPFKKEPLEGATPECSALLLVLAAGALPLGCGDDSDSSTANGAAAGTPSSDAGMPGASEGGASNGGASSGDTPGGGAGAADAGASSGGAPSTVPDE